MRCTNVGHHTPIGCGNARQRGNLARVVHAHLHYRNLVLRLQAQQFKRQAECIVQIPLGFVNVELRAQSRSHGLFGRRLARRARDGNHAQAPPAAYMRGQRLQSDQRVRGNQ